MEIQVKRLDLIHPEAPGNKYFKLKYNLLKAEEQQAKVIITPGGPFSNHLHAVAQACKGRFQTIGLVHGEKPPVLSPTLEDCLHAGMHLEFVERTWYSQRNTEAFKQWVREEWRESYFVPEGGSNYLGVMGCMEILTAEDKKYDALAVPVGTATTLAGLLLSAKPEQRILAFPALNDPSLKDRLRSLLYWSVMDDEIADDLTNKVEWVYDYTFGGFARITPELQAFIEEQNQRGLPLDRVYTSKMMFGLMDMQRSGSLDPSTSILAIHTGGLQGNRPA